MPHFTDHQGNIITKQGKLLPKKKPGESDQNPEEIPKIKPVAKRLENPSVDKKEASMISNEFKDDLEPKKARSPEIKSPPRRMETSSSRKTMNVIDEEGATPSKELQNSKIKDILN